MFGWKLLSAFLMGFMPSAKMHMKMILQVRSDASERPEIKDKLLQSFSQHRLKFTIPNFRNQSWATLIKDDLRKSQPLCLQVE